MSNLNALDFFDVAIEAFEQVQDESRRRVQLWMIEFKKWDPTIGLNNRLMNRTRKEVDHGQQGKQHPCRIQS